MERKVRGAGSDGTVAGARRLQKLSSGGSLSLQQEEGGEDGATWK